ncbi:SDR family oxidoreductase [Pedobacter nanyangensis]|uniref:SDR family oxidoreductase n=1 Tax=Pedobacter nanyangensis TaxID=1562389 RepID=UPI000DE34F0F|nr:SDR family oxidoreductase [Pedobacter nanyangensis]
MKDKAIIITGAAMGLGYATAKELASRGANLTLVDFNSDVLLDTVKKELSALYPSSTFISVKADVSKELEVKNYVDQTVKTFGKIDGLYNNAGIAGGPSEMTEYDMDLFKKVIEINLMGVYYGMRYTIPEMKKRNFGRIVNVASTAGIRGVFNMAPYVSSKHAVSGITKSAGIEYGQFNILTNAIAPGAILTPMLADVLKKINPVDPKAAEKAQSANNPTKRLGLPEEVAKFVAFLIAEENSYINGQTIAIDGGESQIFGTF